MYQRLSEVFRDNIDASSGGKILSISGSEKLASLLGVKEPRITEAAFPEYNMLNLSFGDNEFDYVVSDQILEHIEGDPQKAVDESYRVLKPGGVAVHTTCFLNPVHKYPKDLWRFTPDALRLLCKKFSTVLDADGWGNPYVLLMIWADLRLHPIPIAKWHPLNKMATVNYDNWPTSTWIVYRK